MAAGKRRRREKEREEEGSVKKPLELELKLYRDIPWTINKKLTESDINHHLSRLILPGYQVEKQVFPFFNPQQLHAVLCGSRKGLEVKVKDLDDEGSSHKLSFKRWESTGSYKLGENWISDFVEKKGLRKDDVIGMLWDNYNRCFCFSVLERSPLAADSGELVTAAIPPRPDPCLCEFARKHLRLSPPMPQP